MIKQSDKKFFSRLSYSFGNEDWRVERQALKIQPEDTVVCVTASGDRPLDLLLDECKELISVDLNPIQNYLCKLKATAMRHFNYDDYLSVLGAKEDKFRSEKIDRLLPLLTLEEKNFWIANRKLLNKGVLYQGAVERLCKKIAVFMRIFRGKKIDTLFEIEDIETQKKFVNEVWDSTFWRKLFCSILNSKVIRRTLHDPGFLDPHDNSIRPGNYIYERIHRSLETAPANENPFLTLIFKGRVPSKAFPPYLTPTGTHIISKRLSKMRWENANMIDYLESVKPSSIDCFSLSDIASYMDALSFDRLTRAVLRAASANARFCIRQFMSNHSIPKDIAHCFVRNNPLEEELEKQECCCIYRLMVGHIDKTTS